MGLYPSKNQHIQILNLIQVLVPRWERTEYIGWKSGRGSILYLTEWSSKKIMNGSSKKEWKFKIRKVIFRENAQKNNSGRRNHLVIHTTLRTVNVEVSKPMYNWKQTWIEWITFNSLLEIQFHKMCWKAWRIIFSHFKMSIAKEDLAKIEFKNKTILIVQYTDTNEEK